MRAAEIKVGQAYLAKVSGIMTVVRVTGERRDMLSGRTHWTVVNMRTGRMTFVRGALRFRRAATDADIGRVLGKTDAETREQIAKAYISGN